MQSGYLEVLGLPPSTDKREGLSLPVILIPVRA